MNVFEAAVAEDRSLISTFQTDGSVPVDFAPRVVELVRRARGEVWLGHLQLSADGQMSRIANEDRAKFGKLRNADLLARLKSEFEACERAVPAADIVSGMERVSVEISAGVIAAQLSQLQSQVMASGLMVQRLQSSSRISFPVESIRSRSVQRGAQKFKRFAGEKAHVFGPVREAGFERAGDFELAGPEERHAGVAGGVAIAIAGGA